MSQQQRAAIDALLRGAPYDPSASIADERAPFAQAQTRPLPEGVTARTATLGGRPALELRIPGPAGPAVLLYLHGGAYALGSARTGASLAAQLACRIGARAVSLDYRLAPEHPFPAAVDDGLAAYRELLDGGTRPEHLVLAGDSAGGGLAVATLLAARDAGLPQPAAVAVFSPWADLTLSGASMQTKHGVDPLFTRERMGTYARAYLGDHDGTDSLASPVFADLTGLPPLLVQVGSHEVLLDDAVRLAGAAGTADVPVTLEITDGVPHVFQNFAGTLDDADRALDRCGLFLAAAIGP
ncbi:MAG TPA: alpha/beta hydrolase [Streptosporangiales bacterium]